MLLPILTWPVSRESTSAGVLTFRWAEGGVLVAVSIASGAQVVAAIASLETNIYVTDGMFARNGTTSVPKSVLRYVVDKVRLFASI